MKRIEEYEKEIQSAASEHLNRHIGSGVMHLCGKSGMGKTLLTWQYVKDHGGLYFSFRFCNFTGRPFTERPRVFSCQAT